MNHKLLNKTLKKANRELREENERLKAHVLYVNALYKTLKKEVEK